MVNDQMKTLQHGTFVESTNAYLTIKLFSDYMANIYNIDRFSAMNGTFHLYHRLNFELYLSRMAKLFAHNSTVSYSHIYSLYLVMIFTKSLPFFAETLM